MQGSSHLMEHVQHKHYYWPLALFSEKQKKMKGTIINEPRHMQVLTWKSQTETLPHWPSDSDVNTSRPRFEIFPLRSHVGGLQIVYYCIWHFACFFFWYHGRVWWNDALVLANQSARYISAKNASHMIITTYRPLDLISSFLSYHETSLPKWFQMLAKGRRMYGMSVLAGVFQYRPQDCR